MTYENIITVSEFGQFAPEVDLTGYSDPTVSGMISQASRQACDYLMYSPLAENITNEVKGGLITVEGDLLIFPQKVPVLSISALSITKGTETINLTLQDTAGNTRYNIDYTKRNIRYPYGELTLQGLPVFTDVYQLRGTQFYTKMSYRGGWEQSELPQTIKQAVILLTKDILTGKDNPMGLSSLSQGQVRFGFGGRTEGISSLVKQAYQLLGPYRRIG